ncbi:hypothetical protein AB6A40_006496 [Gnathostoma spinigerum]|uniref:Protein amnionless n=1 Tax=Gnathostoma spinigerum TaxID=75299 RepID=A0ABD6ESY2_9BILA
MHEICSFKTCESTKDFCNPPVHPVGHCCSVCGTIIEFRAAAIDFDELRDALPRLRNGVPEAVDRGIQLSLLRVDHNDSLPKYQISIFGPNNSVFDEDTVFKMAYIVSNRLQSYRNMRNGMAVATMHHVHSTDRRRYKIGSFLVVFFMVVLVLVVSSLVGILIVYYQRNPRFRLALWNSSHIGLGAVRWNRLGTEDQVVLLEDPLEGDSASTSQSHSLTQNILEICSLKQRSVQKVESYTNPNLKKREAKHVSLIDDLLL